MNESVQRQLSRDAIIVVPGIMGSELIDTTTGRVLWGLADPRWYVSAWTSGDSLNALSLTEDERAGRYGRVRATRLLRFPAFAPLLAGFEPYTPMLKAVRAVVHHREAVAEFAYDWRLPVQHNATLLAEFAHRHLEKWRRHPAHLQASHGESPPEPARLVLVAHSMGGLIARQLATIPGMAQEIRATVTLGSPFFGAPKVVQLLASGAGAALPMPRARLRLLAGTLPGVHDLLPVYRCVTGVAPVGEDAGDGREPPALGDARRLTLSDVRDLGGDSELAAASFAWHERLATVPMNGHVQVVGAHQPTVQSLTIEAGTAVGHQFTWRPIKTRVRAGHRFRDRTDMVRTDMGGDGTVPRESGQLPDHMAMPLAQSHGALASTSEARLIVQDVITDRRTGPWQGTRSLGLDAPDVVGAGIPFRIGITGTDNIMGVSCRIFDVTTGLQVDAPAVRKTDGLLAAVVESRSAGLYRVHVDGGGVTPVSQMIMAIPAD